MYYSVAQRSAIVNGDPCFCPVAPIGIPHVVMTDLYFLGLDFLCTHVLYHVSSNPFLKEVEYKWIQHIQISVLLAKIRNNTMTERCSQIFTKAKAPGVTPISSLF